MIKPLNCQQFFAQPAILKKQPCYLIIGDDGYLVDKVYRGIKDIIKKTIPVFEQVTLYGDELEITALSDYLESYSLFADNRLLIIRNADRLGEEDKSRKQPEKAKRMLELVANYLQNPEDSQVLILIADSVDSRLTGWKKIKESCQTIECEPIKYAGEMKAWLETTLRANKKSMEDNAKELFLTKVELDFCSAENEIEKLFIFCGERNRITEQDVITTMPTTRAGALSDFYKVLGNRNSKEVLLKVNEMLENDWVPLQIMSNFIRFFQTVWKIHALEAKHLSPGEIIAKHLPDVFPSQRANYLAYAGKFKFKEIPLIFADILETDASIKLSMAEPEVLLNILAIKICNERKN
jgi:DNA polymerase-3 subunit delta